MKSSKHHLPVLRPAGFVIRHLLLSVLLLALAACTDNAPLTPDAAPEDTPLTPVTFSLTLQGTQAPGTRSNTRADGDGSTLTAAQIAAIPAGGEITADTELSSGSLFMYLPGVTNTGGLNLNDPDDNTGIGAQGIGYSILVATSRSTINGTPSWEYMGIGSSLVSLPQLYMKDFSHDRSRLGIVAAQKLSDGYDHPHDYTYAIATRTNYAYPYTLRHATAKVSLLLQDKDKQPIPADAISNISISSYYTCYNLSNLSGEELINAEDPFTILSFVSFLNWANTPPSGKSDLPGPDDLELACYNNYAPNTFNAKQAASQASAPGSNIPTNLWNVLVDPNPTHDLSTGGSSKNTYPRYTTGQTYTGETTGGSPFSVTTIATGRTYPKAAPGYTGGSGSTQQPICVLPYLDATNATSLKTHCITVTLKDGGPGSALPAGTYRIPLSSIALTGLPENDARRNTTANNGTGTLKYLLPGEHLLVVLTLDRLQGLTATATIGNWSLTDVNLGNLGDSENTEGERVGISESSSKGANGAPLYLVNTLEGLQAFANMISTGKDLNGNTLSNDQKMALNCTLNADIDLSKLPKDNWTAIGNTSSQYTGTFDGGGYTISGLNISTTTNCQGLFGCVGPGGVVKNITLKNLSVTGDCSVGGVVGKNYGAISKCHVEGAINSINRSTNFEGAGGVVGLNLESGSVTACYYTTGNVYGQNVGGVVGKNYGSIAACYSTGTVQNKTTNAGGVVGQNYGTIIACYATGAVSGGYKIGSVVASNISNGIVQYCASTQTAVAINSGNTSSPYVVQVANNQSLTNIRNNYVASSGAQAKWGIRIDPTTCALLSPGAPGYDHGLTLDGSDGTGSIWQAYTSGDRIKLWWEK